MFIPLIIAILLGLVSPAANTNNSCNGGGTVQINSDEDPTDPGSIGGPDTDGPGSGGTGSGGTGPGGTGTGGGTGGGGTGGDSGQNPPPKP